MKRNSSSNRSCTLSPHQNMYSRSLPVKRVLMALPEVKLIDTDGRELGLRDAVLRKFARTISGR